jgi:DNA invertase Pin-like site-specific DNA recombinase
MQPKKIVGYIRVSTDDQDIGKQRETVVHHAKRLGLSVTDFVEVEVSSMKDLSRRKLDFLESLKSGDILICTETSRLSR